MQNTAGIGTIIDAGSKPSTCLIFVLKFLGSIIFQCCSPCTSVKSLICAQSPLPIYIDEIIIPISIFAVSR